MFKDLPDWLSILIYVLIGLHLMIFLVYITLLIRSITSRKKIETKVKTE